VLNELRGALTGRDGVSTTAQTLVTNIIILALNFGTGVITARALGPDGRGVLAAVVMWPQLAAYVLTLGLPASLLYNLKQRPTQARELFWTAITLSVALGGIAAIAGAALLPSWLATYPPHVVRAAQTLTMFAPFSLLSLVLTAALQARDEFGAYNAARAFTPLVALILLGACVMTVGLTPLRAATMVVIAGIPAVIWLLLRFRHRYSRGSSDAMVAARPLLSYGARVYGSDLLQALLAYIDRAIVVAIFAPSLMGLYVVAATLAQTLMMFSTAAASVVFAKAAGRPTSEVVPLAGRALRVSIAITVLTTGVAAFAGPFALRLVYGPEYLAAATAFRILLADVVLRGACWILMQAFLATGRPGLVSALQGIALVVRVALLFLLAGRHGPSGAAVALLLSTAVQLAVTVGAFPLVLKRRPPGFLLRWSDLPPALRNVATPSS
jgi:enterobacterial common antigen flippase